MKHITIIDNEDGTSKIVLDNLFEDGLEVTIPRARFDANIDKHITDLIFDDCKFIFHIYPEKDSKTLFKATNCTLTNDALIKELSKRLQIKDSF